MAWCRTAWVLAVSAAVQCVDAAGQVILQDILSHDGTGYKGACPKYQYYAAYAHPPFTTGDLALPLQRPAVQCRTFSSPLVEQVIRDVTSRMTDPDLARLFENAFPNTLDTTVSWHVDGSEPEHRKGGAKAGSWKGPQSFIVTGDITAEWLRDSTNQLQGYQALASKDKRLSKLILGAINTQAEYVILSPYCNAFQPPPPSNLPASQNGQSDVVHPAYEPSRVFECKYELDSLAHFLRLGNEFHNSTKSTEFVNERWLSALDTLMEVLEQQSRGAFSDATGAYRPNEYTFRRQTNTGTETLSLAGLGNPANGGTGLVRSAFRPSDDATILPFLVPANAMMAVELDRSAQILQAVGKKELAAKLSKRAEGIRKGIYEYGVVRHKVYGEVFAYETDGYGSHILMDDANLPSLLALPLTGFVQATDSIYVNTRRMILERRGNPYYLGGRAFSGVGGPHIGLSHAWPMSRLVQAMTSDDDDEILGSIMAVRNSSRLGLVHESINVNYVNDYTRSWFAWANSVFAQTILDVAARKPHLIFGKGAKPYVVGEEGS